MLQFSKMLKLFGYHFVPMLKKRNLLNKTWMKMPHLKILILDVSSVKLNLMNNVKIFPKIFVQQCQIRNLKFAQNLKQGM